jgi:hypothetical protein
MGRKSYVKTVNANPTSVLANSIIPIGATLTTGYNRCNIERVGDSVVIHDRCSNGYKITVNITLTAPVAGTVQISVQQNGTTVIGATASTTIATATTESKAVSFSTIIKSTGGSTNDVITLVTGPLAITTSNVEFDVEVL